MGTTETKNPRTELKPRPRIGVFDSGVGGLTVYQAIRAAIPDAIYSYCSDNEFHPYGTKADDAVAQRTLHVCERFVEAARLDIVVIACNTASTVALGILRAHLAVPVVGVVPAIKPAAGKTQSGVIGLLATPATIKRQYVDELIRSFAAHCHVVRVGSSRLVELAEEKARGKEVSLDAVRSEIAPLFVAYPDVEKSLRLDSVVLGCTHFPLLKAELEAAAPWPVQWIDSGAAIAARVDSLIRDWGNGRRAAAAANDLSGAAYVTRRDASAVLLEPILRRFGFQNLHQL